jgi:signal transduction histidine kinase/tetratricopeptide (TPR) repeat protein
VNDTSQLVRAIDSLVVSLKNSTTEIQRIDLLNVIAERLLPIAPERALTLANVTYRYSNLYKHPEGAANSYIIKGLYFTQTEVFDSALFYFSFDSIFQKPNSKLPYAMSLVGKGNLLRLQRKPNDALHLIKQSQKIVEEYSRSIDSLNETQRWLDCQRVMGIIHQSEGRAYFFKADRLQALECYMKSLAVFSKYSDKHNRSIALCDIAECFEKMGDFEKAIEYYSLCYETASRFGNIHVASSSLNNLGIIYENLGNFVIASDFYERSLAIRKVVGDKKGIAVAFNNLGNVLKKQGDIAKALDYYHQSIRIKEELNDQNGIALSLNNIGIIYVEQKEYDKALDYYQRSLEIREGLGDSFGIAGSYNNLGVVYRNLKDLDKALEYYTKSLTIRMKIGDKRGIASVLNNIGIIHKTKGDIEKAIEYYEKSVAIQHELGQKSNISSTLSNIGHLYLKENNLNKASAYGEKSYTIAKEVGNPMQIKMAAKLKEEVCRKKGDYRNALKFYEEYIVMRDSLDNIQNRELTEKRYWQYEYQKKTLADSLQHQQAIEVKNLMLAKKQEESKRQLVVIYALFFVFILMIVLAMLIYRGYLMKIKTNKLISEKNLMLEQAFEEIKATSEALAHKNEILFQQHHEIESQRNSLSELNSELQSINEEIMAQKEELERTQEQLVLSEKMASIGVLTAGIAHEINNPINFVYGGVNSIMRDLADVEQVLEIIKDIENSNLEPALIVEQIVQRKRMYDFDEAYRTIGETINDVKLGAQRTAEIIQGLRDFSHSESDEFGFTNINKTIEGVLVLLKNKYKNRVEIVKELDEGLPDVECKAGKINQVIMNLLSNAIDAISETGEIRITSKLSNGMCCISVHDNGSGIKPEVLPKIFDPFFTTKKVGKGTGLGLSISYGIIEEHRGTIEVKSEVGKGSEFTVKWPIKQ